VPAEICKENEIYCNVRFMNERKLHWDDLQLFLSIARHSGLAGAAKETGKSPPTLGRRMQALEEALGQELFLRHARGYDLTDEGQVLLGRAQDLEQQILPLQDLQNEKYPLVKISAGSWMTHVLCQEAAEILRGDLKARLRFISAEHVLDITRREAVIGIRNSRPEQRGLACRKVGKVKFAGYATDPKIKEWIQVQNNTPSANWLAEQEGFAISAQVTAPRNALDLAIAGIGRALLPTFIGDRESGLSRVTKPIEELTHDQWLVTHQEERFLPAVRQTIDRIYSIIRGLNASPDSAG